MAEKKDKLWIYSELFYPEETSTSFIMTKIANKLVDKYEVEVISGFPTYDKNQTTDLLHLDSRIKLTRLKSYAGNKDQILSRILKLLALSFQFFFHLIFKVKSGEKIFTVTNPAPFLVFASFIKKFKNIEITLLVHDVFPENTLAAGFLKDAKDFKYKLAKRIFDKAYSRIDHLIVLGRDMEKFFGEKMKDYHKLPKISVIENWTDVKAIFPMKNIPHNKEKIVFQFAGNLGSIQGLEALMKVIAKVQNNNIIFEFIGDGKIKNTMLKLVNERNIQNVIFKPPFLRNQQNEILNSCDIAIVSLADKMLGLGVPSKTYNILAAGKPILYIGDRNSEVGILMRDFDLGFQFEPKENVELLAFFNSLNIEETKILIQEKGLNARKLAEDKFSEDIILDKYITMI